MCTYVYVYAVSLAAILKPVSTSFLSALQIFGDHYHILPYSLLLSLKISCSSNNSNLQ